MSKIQMRNTINQIKNTIMTRHCIKKFHFHFHIIIHSSIFFYKREDGQKMIIFYFEIIFVLNEFDVIFLN